MRPALCHSAEEVVRRSPEHKPVRQALVAFAKRKGITLYVSRQSQRANRQFALWEKVRAGRITDPRTLRAIEQDARLKKAFQKLDRAAEAVKEAAC